MNVPKQAQPVQRQKSRSRSMNGIRPSGNYTQCCGPANHQTCKTKWCALHLSNAGCHGDTPYINCFG